MNRYFSIFKYGQTKTTPKEASNIFHSIMKVTVSPKKFVCSVCGWLGKPVANEPGKYKCKRGHEFSDHE